LKNNSATQTTFIVDRRHATPFMALVTAAVVAALPFGWGLRVTAAYLVAGPDFGQLPALTVPVGIIAAIIFALLPLLSARKRLLMMVGGTELFILLNL
jgi:hypothetical protein